jgi:hypothetical protein
VRHREVLSLLYICASPEQRASEESGQLHVPAGTHSVGLTTGSRSPLPVAYINFCVNFSSVKVDAWKLRSSASDHFRTYAEFGAVGL